MKHHQNNQTVLEGEIFYPSGNIIRRANIREYDQLYKRSIENREGFWADEAKKIKWYKK